MDSCRIRNSHNSMSSSRSGPARSNPRDLHKKMDCSRRQIYTVVLDLSAVVVMEAAMQDPSWIDGHNRR